MERKPGADGLVLPVVFLALLASSLPCGKAAEWIPAERLTNWTPGVTVGVPGGIPTNRTHLIDVTKAPYNADKTGKTDAQPAIVKAIKDAKDNDVVYLPAGTYLANHAITVYAARAGSRSAARGRIRRSSSPAARRCRRQRLCPPTAATGGMATRRSSTLRAVTSGGRTELTVGDTNVMKDYPKGGVGEVVQIAIKGDKKLPVLSSGGAPSYDRKYITRIVAKTATAVTISPPLLFDVPAELTPIMRPVGRYAESVGIEDLTVDGTDCPSGGCLVSIGQSYGCWVRNVTVRKRSTVSLVCMARCNARSGTATSTAARRPRARTGGLFLGMSSHCLIEDNIISPDTEVDGGSAGNVFAYNFCDDDWIQGGLLGMSIDTNHAPHNSFNLYEGNYVPRFQADGYWGSCSHDTAFRNWFHASSDKTTEWWVAVNINRFTRCYNIVGNILGKKGYTWLYEVELPGSATASITSTSLGFPNMGNGWCNGKTAQPSKGKYWADWDPVVGTTIKGVLTETAAATASVRSPSVRASWLWSKPR